MKKGLSLVLGFLVFVLLCSAGLREAGAAEKAIIATGRYVGLVHIWKMGRFAKKYGIDIEIRKLFTYTQMQQAVELGHANFGSVGYQNLVLMAAAGGPPKVQVVAGIYRAGQDVVFHKDVKISKWKDIEGKNIARVPGSFADFLFRFAARTNGVNMKNVKLTDLRPSPTMHLALERREVDALVIWVPALAFPIAKGFGYRPSITINDTSIGSINGLMVIRSDVIQKKPKLAVNMTKAYVESLEFYAENKDAWLKDARSLTGSDMDVLLESHKHFIPDRNVYLKNLQALAKNAYTLKMVKKDTSGTVGQWVNYGILMKATGKGKMDLGG